MFPSNVTFFCCCWSSFGQEISVCLCTFVTLQYPNSPHQPSVQWFSWHKLTHINTKRVWNCHPEWQSQSEPQTIIAVSCLQSQRICANIAEFIVHQILHQICDTSVKAVLRTVLEKSHKKTKTRFLWLKDWRCFNESLPPELHEEIYGVKVGIPI